MPEERLSAREYRELLNQYTAANKRAIELLEQEKSSLNVVFDMRKRMAIEQEIMNERQRLINKTIEFRNELEERGYRIHGNLNNSLNRQHKQQLKILKNSERRLKINQLLLTTIDGISKSFLSNAGSMKTFFMASDKAIKNVSLELGLSSDRSEILRNNFEDSAMFAARMGIDMQFLTQMASTYADETGRARLLNEESLNSITLMAKGTNMGAETAARMAGQYELMGFAAKDTVNEVQRIVDTTERMGVNTNKVFRAINKNFKTLQKYTFRNGVKSMADMAIYAEKFKINMDNVFEPMERGRRLDSVIEMSAQLQVLGGQFANLSDPLSMLFESRNDPEAYMRRINEMTKGMVTVRKTAEGFSFELASPMARDQLTQAAQALGLSTEELTQQAFRMREIQLTRSQMFNKGFTEEERNIIEGLAKFDRTTGRMFVEIGNQRKDISDLARNDIKALITQRETLESRALAAQTFDEAFRNTVLELKSTLLPMLQGINSILKDVRPFVTSITDWIGDLSKTNKDILKIVGMVTGVAMLASPLIKILKGLVPSVSSVVSASLGRSTASAASSTMSGSQLLGRGRGALAAGKGKALAGLGTGVGVGAAGLGIGGGVMLAAKGISELADSMAKLDNKQVEALERIATTLSIAFPAAAIGVGVLAAVATPAAVPLLALGGAILGMGAGIGIATAGIGYMSEGLSKLADVDLLKIGTGLASVGAASLLFANPLTTIGLGATTASILAIGSSADNLERVGNAFYNIGAVLKGSSSQFKDVKDTIQAIANTEISANSGIAQLTSLLSKPLKVEFNDKEVSLITNVDLNVDGRTLTRVVTNPAYNAIQLIDQQTGKRGI